MFDGHELKNSRRQRESLLSRQPPHENYRQQPSSENQNEHSPVFSMHNQHIMSVRKGDWKLFVRKPRYRKKVDLSTWKDSRAADGTTIIARMSGQPTPAQYPGVTPEEPESDIQLFNLKTDITESQNLADKNPEKVNELLQIIANFKESIPTE